MIKLGSYDLLEGDIKMLEGGLDGLLSIPECIEPDKNDWGDEDGLEVDLINELSLSPHKVTTMLYAPSVNAGNRFVANMLKSHSSRLLVYGRAFDARATSFRLKSRVDEREEIEASFVVQEDIPSVSISPSYSPFGHFQILSDSIVGFAKYPTIKEGHSIGSRYIGGHRVLKSSSEIDVHLFIKVASWSELWQERDKMRAWMTSAGEKTIEQGGVQNIGYCKRLDTAELYQLPDGGIIWISTLKFVVTKP